MNTIFSGPNRDTNHHQIFDYEHMTRDYIFAMHIKHTALRYFKYMGYTTAKSNNLIIRNLLKTHFGIKGGAYARCQNLKIPLKH